MDDMAEAKRIAAGLTKAQMAILAELPLTGKGNPPQKAIGFCGLQRGLTAKSPETMTRLGGASPSPPRPRRARQSRINYPLDTNNRLATQP